MEARRTIDYSCCRRQWRPTPFHTVPLDGSSAHTPFVEEYSVDPVWSPDGKVVVFSGADIGTTFPVKAVASNASAHTKSTLTLSRGARPVCYSCRGNGRLWSCEERFGTRTSG